MAYSDPNDHNQIDPSQSSRAVSLLGLGFVAAICGAIAIGAWNRPDPPDRRSAHVPGPRSGASGEQGSAGGLAGSWEQRLSDGRPVSLCVLAVSNMAIDGGSLFFSGYDPQRHRWRATWRGGSTGSGMREDCGNGASLLLSNLAASTLLTSPGS